MAKSKASRSKKPPMRQAKLDFFAKRNAAGAKGKVVKSEASSANASRSPVSIDESEDEDVDVTPKAKRIRTAAGPATKRRKVESDVSSPAEKGKGVFKPREGFENTGEPRSPSPEIRPTLYPNDKRWTKLYNTARERMGEVEPVHSRGLTKVHHILRVFDLSYEFGPCVGVPRLQRWERAHALGLNPPPEIKEILTTREGVEKEEYAQCVLFGDL